MEALESMAVNVGNTFAPNEYKKDSATVDKEIAAMSKNNTVQPLHQLLNKPKGADEQMVSRLRDELESFKSDSAGAVKGLHEAMKALESKVGSNSKFLPPLVRSGRQQVVHKNNKTLVYANPAMWRTNCGWNYYGSSYEFVEGNDTMVSCAKCLSTAHSKEVETAV